MPQPRWITERLFERLRERLGLSDVQETAQDMVFFPTIIGTTNIDNMNEDQQGYEGDSGVLAAGAGGYTTLYTVPAGTRLKPAIINIYRDSGDNTFRDTLVLQKRDGSRIRIYETVAGQTSISLPAGAIPSQIHSGDQVQIQLDGAGTSQSRFYIHMWATPENE